jgi:hypothetical protein
MNRRTIARRMIVSMVVLGLCLAGLAAFENCRGAQRLKATTTRLARTDFALDPKLLLPVRPPDDQNVAVAFLELIPALRTFELPTEVPPPKPMQIIAPGKAVSFIRKPGGRGVQEQEYTWENLRPIQMEALRHLRNLSTIAARPRFLSPVDISKGLADMELKALAGLPAASRVFH